MIMISKLALSKSLDLGSMSFTIMSFDSLDGLACFVMVVC